MVALFQAGSFKLASGQETDWKIECDALTDEDWQCLAGLIRRRYVFSGVTGVPSGGVKLAKLLEPDVTPHCITHLIVDDVYTTGGSIRSTRDALIARPDGGDGRRYLGVVIFARARIAPADTWVRSMLQMWE